MILLYLTFGFIAFQNVLCDQKRCDLFELTANESKFDKIQVIDSKTHFYLSHNSSEHHWIANGSAIESHRIDNQTDSNTTTLELKDCNSQQYELNNGPNGTTILKDIPNTFKKSIVKPVIGVFCQNNSIYVLVLNDSLIRRLEVPNSSTIQLFNETKPLKDFFSCNESIKTGSKDKESNKPLIIIICLIILIAIFVPLICCYINFQKHANESDISYGEEFPGESGEKDLLNQRTGQKSIKLKSMSKSYKSKGKSSTKSKSRSKSKDLGSSRDSGSSLGPMAASSDSSAALMNSKSHKSSAISSQTSQDNIPSLKSDNQ